MADGGVRGRNQYFEATKGDMEILAGGLSNMMLVGRPVVERTGLTGTYDFRIEATPAVRMSNDPQIGDVGAITAVQEQLGLKLESKKAQIEVLVVDHWEKPTAN